MMLQQITAVLTPEAVKCTRYLAIIAYHQGVRMSRPRGEALTEALETAQANWYLSQRVYGVDSHYAADAQASQSYQHVHSSQIQ